jgi:putative endonuclease
MWYLYILRCSDGSLYTGVTTDVARRLKQHRAGRGSKALRAKLPIRLVYKEKHPTRSASQKREAEIKRWNHKKKQALVHRKNRRGLCYNQTNR